jgi:hypothetical protein
MVIRSRFLPEERTLEGCVLDDWWVFYIVKKYYIAIRLSLVEILPFKNGNWYKILA